MFCGLTGRMSKEHAWPQWLGRGIEVNRSQTSLTFGLNRTGESLLSETQRRRVTKNSSVLSTRVREVCAPCNNGWMSRLETAVRPLLEKLWAPSYPLGRTTISVDEAAVLATWAAKMAWVREKANGPDLTSTPQMRGDLAATGRPPDLTTVWFARFDGLNNFGSYVAQSEVTHLQKDWDTEDSRRVQVCSLSFCGLAIVVKTDSGPGLRPMYLQGETWQPVWPVGSAVQWPPSRAVSDDEVYNVASQVSRWATIPAVELEPNHDGWRIEHRN